MKTTFFLTVCVSLACALTTFATGADEKAVRDADEAWSKAAQAKDVEKIVSYFSDDATVLPANAPAITTKDAIRKAWKEDLETTNSLNWKATKVEVAKSGDLAFVVGTYEWSYNDPSGKQVSDHGKYVEVWEKKGGTWKCGIDIYNSDLPATPSTSPAPGAAEKK